MSGFFAGAVRVEDVDTILRRFRVRIYRLALAISGASDRAEDITQEVSCRISAAIVNKRDVRNQWAWIRQITVHCAVDALKRRETTELTPDLAAPDPNIQRALLVATTLGRLSVEHRTILALSFFEDLSYQEIADTLAIPIGSVSSRLHHAKIRFREEWEKED